MAFRITYRGAVIEADTARDVQELLVIMATPVPRQLTAGAVDVEPVSPRRSPAGRRGKRRLGGGVRKARVGRRPAGRVRPRTAPVAAPPASPRRGVPNGVEGRILDALRSGLSKPRELAARVHAADVAFRDALLGLRESGRVRVEGATNSRRYFLPDGRPRPKEGL